jgi:hypothetical protein
VTKDAGCGDSHVLHARPARLLLISTGNISIRELEALMVPLIPITIQEFQVNSFLELGRSGIINRAWAPSVGPSVPGFAIAAGQNQRSKVSVGPGVRDLPRKAQTRSVGCRVWLSRRMPGG